MARGFGEIEALQALLPDAAVLVLLLLTYLGSAVLYAVCLSLAYWFGDRARGIRLVALVGAGLALGAALKVVLAVPRPPGPPPLALDAVPVLLRPLYVDATMADGYGFPSGHAFGSTVVYGALAHSLRGWTYRRRATLAGTAVFLVCVSRVALGVHYAVDVVAGVVLGLLFLAAAYGVIARRPDPAFVTWFAAGVAGVTVVVAPSSGDAVFAFGAVAGAALAWTVVEVPLAGWPLTRRTLRHASIPIVTAAVVGGLGTVVGFSPVVRFAVAATAVAVLVASPAFASVSRR